MTGLEGEVLFELRRIGAVVKVSAVHVQTNIEVSLAGPASAGAELLKAAALRKLAYMVRRQSQA
jgi:hypothetical protein